MKTKDIVRLRFLSRHLRIPIAAGPNKGMLWSLSTRRAFLRGVFERARCEVIAQLSQGRACFWDLGAHFGYVTLMASPRVQPTGEVIAIEPNRDNLWYLRKHVAWNRLGNVTVVPVAGADGKRT